MCGICAIISISTSSFPIQLVGSCSVTESMVSKLSQLLNSKVDDRSNYLADKNALLSHISLRGPDISKTITYNQSLLSNQTNRDIYHETMVKCMSFNAGVLHLRGSKVAAQPYEPSTDDVFMWNGELFGGLDNALEKNPHKSDTIIMAEAISKALQNTNPNLDEASMFIQTLSSVQGPFSMIYWSQSTKRLYFSRDFLGRRSLQLSISSQATSSPPSIQLTPTCASPTILISDLSDFIFSSIAAPSTSPSKGSHPSIEVPTTGLFYLDLAPLFDSSIQPISVVVFDTPTIVVPPVPPPLPPQEFLPTFPIPPPSPNTSESQTSLPSINNNGNNNSSSNSSRPFSTFLAYQLRLVHTPWSNERPAVLLGRLVEPSPSPFAIWTMPSENPSDMILVEGFLNALRRSVSRRVSHIASTYHARSFPYQGHSFEANAELAVLFSGGVDSLTIAAIAGEFCNTIDLLNVSFGSNHESSPDRLTAISSWRELCTIHPQVEWRLICVDISTEDMKAKLGFIRELIYPCDTVMDLNIGSAIHWASTGLGYIYSDKVAETIIELKDNPTALAKLRTSYQSNAKVLLAGMGADEQLGGYARYRHRYNTCGGIERLALDIEIDLKRLWTRNLGRDDRCVSGTGKEARFPFLDEEFMGFLHSIPLSRICRMDLPPGEGEKYIIREAARTLGLTKSSAHAKRSIQFGSYIAKLNFKKAAGSDIL